MIRRGQLVLVLLVAAAALLSLLLFQRKVSATGDPAGHTTSPSTEAGPRGAHRVNVQSSELAAQTSDEPSVPEQATAPAPTAHISPAPAEPVPDTPESTSLPAGTVLENMRTSIRQYAAAFGENPVGTNPEITSALSGQNPKQINFLKADGNRVNAKGELVDTWGTPYFFHQLSGHQMEIRSAGPDRIMYSADDLIIR
jgi:hypothetical protein